MTAAMIALALAAAGTTGATPAPLPIEVLEAGRLEYDVAHDRGVVTGGVVLRRGQVMLRADAATYDARTGEVEAKGHVLLTEPGRAVAAEAMHALLDGPFQAHEVVAFLKDTPLDLSRCRTLDEARSTGRNRVTFGGAVVDRDTPDHFDVSRARVTLCDCGGGPPSWEIHAHRADVIPGKRAILYWPVFYITPRFLFIDQPVPVLALPAAYLPLGERQSGLLMPELSFGGPAGFGISQPLFLALGRSWDATITADYVFGPAEHATKGPGTHAELRWAPLEGMNGELRFALLHALEHDWPGSIAEPPGWNRLALSGFHEQRVSERTFYRLELGVIGDPLYLQDFTGDALLRGAEYRRSAFAITHRTDDVVYEADAAYYLPLLYLDSGNPNVRAPFGTFGTDLSTIHRLPSASATRLPVPVAGPLQLSGTVGVARFAPLRGPTGDEGQNGIGPGDRSWSYLFIDPGERDGRWTPPGPGAPGERLATTRALARAELRAPVTLGVVDVEPWAAATAATYAFDAALAPQADARVAGGVVLSTRIARTYGSGAAAVRHEIEPRVEWRGGSGQAGPGLPNYAYDEMDVALPALVRTQAGDVVAQRMLSAIPGPFSQLQLSLRNRLVAPSGPLSSTFLELVVGQDLDAATGSPSETWARAGAHFQLVSAEAFARFRAFGASAPAGTPPASPSLLDTFTELGGNVTVSDGRGDNVHANLIAIGPGGSPRELAGLDALFDPRPFAETPTAQGQVGVAARLGGALVGYDAFFYARDIPPTTCANGKQISTSPHVFQHVASLVWDSPCHCWKAGFTATLNECDDRPRLGFVFDFSALGAGAIPH